MAAKKKGRVPILGVHPDGATPIGKILEAADSTTSTKIPHRALSLRPGTHALATSSIRAMLVKHHVTPETLARSKAQAAAMKRLGVSPPKALSRFPINATTRKGNLAEIVLAEYITAATGLQIIMLVSSVGWTLATLGLMIFHKRVTTLDCIKLGVAFLLLPILFFGER